MSVLHFKPPSACADPRIFFRGGGVPCQSDKKTHFSMFQRASNFFQGGGGGGSDCLFPIETHMTCDFPGGPDPCPPPPLDPHLQYRIRIVLESHLPYKIYVYTRLNIVLLLRNKNVYILSR